MRPRDLTSKSWSDYDPELVLRSGLSVFIGWITGDIDFCISSLAGNAHLVIPRRIFDKMVDWYVKKCDETFWNMATEVANLYIGERIPDKRKTWKDYKRREWQISADRLWCTTDRRGKNVTRVNRSVLIRGEGLKDQVAVTVFRKADFEKVVNWYNSEYKTKG